MNSSSIDDKQEAERVPFLTAEGIEKLRAELEHLRVHHRPQAAAWLSEVLGDRTTDEGVTESENAQSEFWWVERRIQRIEHILNLARPLEQPHTTAVQLGSKVTVVEGDGAPEVYRVVDPAEADPSRGYISYESPLGRELIGHYSGESVTVQAPDGPLLFKLMAVG